MTRLLKVVGKLPGKLVIKFVNHKHRAKRRAHENFNTKGMMEKVPLYADLIKVTSVTLVNLEIVSTHTARACIER